MTTVLLLLPVAAVLIWLYRRCLPVAGGWTGFDSVLVGFLAALVVAWAFWAPKAEYANAGPVFGELVAVAGAYPILLGGLGLGLAWRHARARRAGA